VLRHYAISALRHLAKHKGHSLINIVGLAIGLAAAILVLLWVRYEMSFDRFHENADRLYRVAFTTEDRQVHSAYLPGLAGPYLKDRYPEILDTTRLIDSGARKVSTDGRAVFTSACCVDSSFFRMFTFAFAQGDPNTALNHPDGAVISPGLAKALFGNADPFGEAFQLEGEQGNLLLRVTGVLEPIPENSTIRYGLFTAFAWAPGWAKKWDMKGVYTYVLLDHNQSYREVSARIEDVYNVHNPGDTPNDFYLQPLKDVHLRELGGGGLIVYITLFSGIGLAILLIACMNFMNLATARFSTRAKEIGVRKVIGATRGQLARQFLAEAAVQALLSLVLALVVLEFLLPPIAGVFEKPLDLEYSWALMLQLVGIALVVGLVAGSYPALFLSSFSPVTVLSGPWPAPTSHRRMFRRVTGTRIGGALLRKLLVIVQFSISIFFALSILVVLRQLNYIDTKDLGFDEENLVILVTQGELFRRHETLKRGLLSDPAVESVTFTANVPIGWTSSLGVLWAGMRRDEIFDMGTLMVDSDYEKTLGMDLVDGRFFSEDFPSDEWTACVVNEAAVKAMRMTDPVGKEITLAPESPYENRRTIVGVVKDFHNETLHGKVRPYTLLPATAGAFASIRLRPGTLPGVLESIEQTVHDIAPDDPAAYWFLDEEMDGRYASERLTAGFILAAALLAMFLSCLGLFGLSAFTAEQHTREIGIRKVLGASLAGITWSLVREHLYLILIAGAVAFPVGYFAMANWLENFAYRTGVGVWTFVVAGGATAAIALATVGGQALRAAMADPVKAIRYE